MVEKLINKQFHLSRPHVASFATQTNSGVKMGITLTKSHVLYFNLLFLRFNCFRY